MGSSQRGFGRAATGSVFALFSLFVNHSDHKTVQFQSGCDVPNSDMSNTARKGNFLPSVVVLGWRRSTGGFVLSKIVFAGSEGRAIFGNADESEA